MKHEYLLLLQVQPGSEGAGKAESLKDSSVVE